MTVKNVLKEMRVMKKVLRKMRVINKVLRKRKKMVNTREHINTLVTSDTFTNVIYT